MTVGVDRSAVETALGGGGLGCPVAGCGGRLAPRGWARARGVRGEVGRVRLRPRRSVCVGCRRTQVLLPASVLPAAGPVPATRVVSTGTQPVPRRTRTGAASSDVVSFPDGSAQVVEDPVSLDTTSTRLPDALAWAAAAATSSTGGVAAGVGVGAAVGAGAAGVGAGVGSDGLGVAVVGAVAAGGDSAGAVATADPTGYSPSTRRALSRRSPTGAAERTPQDPTAQDRTRQPPPRARTGKGRMPSSRGALVGYLGGSPPPP